MHVASCGFVPGPIRSARERHLLPRPVRLIPPRRRFQRGHGFPDRSGAVGLCHSCPRPVQETGKSACLTTCHWAEGSAPSFSQAGWALPGRTRGRQMLGRGSSQSRAYGHDTDTCCVLRDGSEPHGIRPLNRWHGVLLAGRVGQQHDRPGWHGGFEKKTNNKQKEVRAISIMLRPPALSNGHPSAHSSCL